MLIRLPLMCARWEIKEFDKQLDHAAKLTPAVLEKHFRFHTFFWSKQFRRSFEREQSMQRDRDRVDEEGCELCIKGRIERGLIT